MDLIYCAGRNIKFANIAIKNGMKYGARMPTKIHYPLFFADQNYKKPNRLKYMQSLALERPNIATVLDYEKEEQHNEILDWAEEASLYVKSDIIIIPKVKNIISKIPYYINDKKVRLGYSVESKYGFTSVPIEEFGNREVHLLGGSPKKQLQLLDKVNVVSMDMNYIHHPVKFGEAIYGSKRLHILSNYNVSKEEALLLAFEISVINYITIMFTRDINFSVRFSTHYDDFVNKKYNVLIVSYETNVLCYGYVDNGTLKVFIYNQHYKLLDAINVLYKIFKTRHNFYDFFIDKHNKLWYIRDVRLKKRGVK